MTAKAGREITDLLVAWSNGEQDALAPLMDEVYTRLLRLAGSRLRGERADHSLDAAALVHEAFLRLVQQEQVHWHDRAHFFAVAARLMRRILLDHARRRASHKRGRDVLKVPLEKAADTPVPSDPDVLDLDQALRDLEARDAQLAELVVLRYYGGMRKDEVGAVLGLSSATVARRWRTARVWLYDYLRGSE